MKLFIEKNKKQGDKKAFELLKKQVLTKPHSLIGLAVGKTTDELYGLINKDLKKNPNVWKNIKLFQIDENLGFSPKSKLSFNFEIRKELKPLLKITNPNNVFLMDGTKNPKKTIFEASEFINKNKGIDLIILGIGPEYDPHIAYNTKGESTLNSKIRVVKLHPKVAKKIIDRVGSFRKTKSLSKTTLQGITLGLKDILNTKKALLIAYGKEKAKSLQIAFRKVDTKKSSASALLLHKDLTVILDKDAANI